MVGDADGSGHKSPPSPPPPPMGGYASCSRTSSGGEVDQLEFENDPREASGVTVGVVVGVSVAVTVGVWVGCAVPVLEGIPVGVSSGGAVVVSVITCSGVSVCVGWSGLSFFVGEGTIVGILGSFNVGMGVKLSALNSQPDIMPAIEIAHSISKHLNTDVLIMVNLQCMISLLQNRGSN